MFGYAARETEELMPMPIMLAHRLGLRLAAVRRDGTLPYLRPDGKTQVSVRYEQDEHGRIRPVEIVRVLISTQHAEDADPASRILPDLIEHVIEPTLPTDLVDAAKLREKDFVLVNPTGRFVIGGPHGDTGLTGRKIIVDTYGGMARHGGGAFSGKDPTKVDRSAAYAARWAAKNVVAAGLADRCEVQIAYAIGKARPMSVMVDTFGTEQDGLTADRIAAAVQETFDLRPAAILEQLDLRRPIYRRTAAYGHFGRARRGLHVGAHRSRVGAAGGRRPRGRHRLTRSGSGSDLEGRRLGELAPLGVLRGRPMRSPSAMSAGSTHEQEQQPRRASSGPRAAPCDRRRPGRARRARRRRARRPPAVTATESPGSARDGCSTTRGRVDVLARACRRAMRCPVPASTHLEVGACPGASVAGSSTTPSRPPSGAVGEAREPAAARARRARSRPASARRPARAPAGRATPRAGAGRRRRGRPSPGRA